MNETNIGKEKEHAEIKVDKLVMGSVKTAGKRGASTPINSALSVNVEKPQEDILVTEPKEETSSLLSQSKKDGVITQVWSLGNNVSISTISFPEEDSQS